MSKTKSHLVIGIDIGSDTTQVCAVMHSENGDCKPEILEIQEINTEGIFKGNIVNQKELANTLHAVIKQFKNDIFKDKYHLVLSLNASGISSDIINTSIINGSIDNRITDLDLERLEKEATLSVANLRNRKIVHTVPIQYRVDGVNVLGSPVGMVGKRIEGRFLFVFSPSNYTDRLENVFHELKLNVEEVIAGSFAEVISLLNKRQRVAGTALINIGHSTTSILVYENDTPILTSVIGVGSDDITNDIALGLQVSLEDAEKIKINKSEISYSKRKYDEIVDARIEYICEKINGELSKVNRKELLPGGVVLTGNGSKLDKIDLMFREYLKLPVKFANEEIIEFSEGQLNDSSYARVYGLTFLAPIISSDYKLAKLLKNFFNKILNFLKKLLP